MSLSLFLINAVFNFYFLSFVLSSFFVDPGNHSEGHRRYLKHYSAILLRPVSYCIHPNRKRVEEAKDANAVWARSCYLAVQYGSIIRKCEFGLGR